MVPTTPRRRPGVLLARALGAALGVYRLHPGEPQRGPFRAAVDRVAEAARTALAEGDSVVEFAGGRLVGSDGRDDHAERLAQACWTRGVERLVVESVPDARTLDRLCEVLSTPAEALLDAGGAAAVAAALEVDAIRLVEIHPLGGSDVLAALPEEQRATWRRLDQPVEYVQDLIAATEGDEQVAARLLAEVGRLHAALPRALAARAGLARRVRLVVDELPPEARRRLTHAIASHADAPFPADYLSNLNDLQLAEVLAGIGDRQVAVSLAERLGRTPVVDALRREASPDAGGASPVRIADDVLRAGREDRERLRTDYPDSPRPDAVAAVRDYVHAETRPEGLERVLDTWAGEVAAALGERRLGDLELLFDLVAPLGADGRDWTTAALESAVRRGLDPRELHQLIVDESGGEAVAALRAVGDLIAPAVLDHLADSASAGERSAMIALAAELIGDPAPIVARLGDERWYVVRNMCTILERRGDDGVGAPLRVAARHRDPRVRVAAVRALRACLGRRAVTELRDACRDDADDVRQAAMRGLAGLPDGPATLAELAASTGDRRVATDAVATLADAPGDEAGAALERLTARGVPRRVRRQARRALAARS